MEKCTTRTEVTTSGHHPQTPTKYPAHCLTVLSSFTAGDDPPGMRNAGRSFDGAVATMGGCGSLIPLYSRVFPERSPPSSPTPLAPSSGKCASFQEAAATFLQFTHRCATSHQPGRVIVGHRSFRRSGDIEQPSHKELTFAR
jgi:hypothetical protein